MHLKRRLKRKHLKRRGISGRSKRASLCIRGPRKSLRQGSVGRVVVLYEKIRNSEKYVRLVQNMYEESETVVRYIVETTESLKIKVGLHQGSALSPFLFAVIMDRLMNEVRREPPWTMLFADDIVICQETRKEVERRLESWRYTLERRGMKVSRSKTEYLCINGENYKETVKMKDTKVPRMKEFKCLRSTV